MQIQQLSKRGYIARFNDMAEWITNLYLCFAPDHTYLVDTYRSPGLLGELKAFIREKSGDKPIVVVNTHFHWDHIWGNAAFPGSVVLAQAMCRQLMASTWESQWTENQGYAIGDTPLVLPTCTFSQVWTNAADQVKVMHTPGHTVDSATFIDLEDQVVFTGDNIEDPIPYTESPDLQQYIDTLKAYLDMDARVFVSSHSPVTDKSLILRNIHYLEQLLAGREMHFDEAYTARVHASNLSFLKKNR